MVLKWWEKTVEYKFILLCAKEKVLKLAPLDGNEEIAGDTLISNNNKWIIIEFKKDKDSIPTEKSKFIDFDKAEEALVNEDQHHFIVYGSINVKNNTGLNLYCQTYFSKNQQKSIKDILGKGKNKSEFKIYLEKLISYKKSNKGTNSSGNGNLNVENYALVAAVDTDGNIVECQSFNEFAINEGLDKAISNDYSEPSNDYSEPSIDYRNLN